MEPLGTAHGPDNVQPDEITLQLRRILASPPFRNSKRNTQFLRFVVDKALAGNISEIKERLIGVEVFGRPASYDLSADPIVRVAAAELRKRIAQYYAEPDHAAELRVDLPVGTYAPAFHWPIAAPREKPDWPALEPTSSVAEDIVTENGGRVQTELAKAHARLTVRRSSIAASCAVALVAAVFALYYFASHAAQRSLDAFWAPLINEGDSITVCVGDLNYILQAPPFSGLAQADSMAQSHPLNSNAGAALLRIGGVLGSKGKRSILRLAGLTELSDLRQQPVIFVGGLNNPWTQRILGSLRFRLSNRPGGFNGNYQLVTDEKNPAMTTWRIDLSAPVGSITRDYSLVTRLNDPLTGEPVVVLCGLGPYGTAAASDFVSNPNYFSQFSKQATKGWESRNIQIVLETTVINGRPSVPRVVAEQVY
jgi:hypothetical protein